MKKSEFRKFIREAIKSVLKELDGGPSLVAPDGTIQGGPKKKDDEEVEEASATGDVDGYETPYAFVGDTEKDKEEWEKDAVKDTGYKVVGEKVVFYKDDQKRLRRFDTDKGANKKYRT